MPDGLSIDPSTIADIERVKRALKRVEASVAKKVLRKSMRAGLKVVAKIAAANAPVRTGAMKKAIKVMAAKRKVGRISFSLLPRRKYLNIPEGSKSYYPAVVEYGSKKRHIAGRHFMRRAFEAGASTARNTALRLIQINLDLAVKQAASR